MERVGWHQQRAIVEQSVDGMEMIAGAVFTESSPESTEIEFHLAYKIPGTQLYLLWSFMLRQIGQAGILPWFADDAALPLQHKPHGAKVIQLLRAARLHSFIIIVSECDDWDSLFWCMCILLWIIQQLKLRLKMQHASTRPASMNQTFSG